MAVTVTQIGMPEPHTTGTIGRLEQRASGGCAKRPHTPREGWPVAAQR